MIPPPFKSVSIVMIAVQIACASDPWTLAAAHANAAHREIHLAEALAHASPPIRTGRVSMPSEQAVETPRQLALMPAPIVDAAPASPDSTPTPENEPDPEESEDTPAPVKAAAPAAQGAASIARPPLTQRPEALGEVAARRPRTSLWMWTGSAVLVGLFVAGFSRDLRNDRAPSEPESLPDFPDAP